MLRLLVMTIAVCSLSAFGQSNYITVGFIERPPTIFKNADGSLRGELGSKLKAIFDQTSIRLDFLPTQPIDIDSYVGREDQDAMIVTRTLVKQADNYLFSEKPLISLTFYAYHKASTPAVSSLNDLANRSVVVPIALENMRGPMKAVLTDKSKQIKIVAEEGRLTPQLAYIKSGQAEYAISFFSPSNVAMMFSGGTHRRDIVTSELFEIPMYFVIDKSVPDASDIIDSINRVMVDQAISGEQ